MKLKSRLAAVLTSLVLSISLTVPIVSSHAESVSVPLTLLRTEDVFVGTDVMTAAPAATTTAAPKPVTTTITTTTATAANTTVSETTTVTSTVTTTSADSFAGYDVFGMLQEFEDNAVKHGIDVSHHQGTIDWAKVKQGGQVDFAIIRAGYGRYASQVDKQFHANMKGAKEQGIPVGTYWYSYAMSVEEAKLEAEACYSIIKDYKFEYPVYFDIEEKSQRDGLTPYETSAIIEAFCSTLENYGYYVGVYSYASFLNDRVYQHVLDRYTVWVAHINVAQPAYSRSVYNMWQYSWTGKINGISGDVDMNLVYMDFPRIIKRYKLNNLR